MGTVAVHSRTGEVKTSGGDEDQLWKKITKIISCKWSIYASACNSKLAVKVKEKDTLPFFLWPAL